MKERSSEEIAEASDYFLRNLGFLRQYASTLTTDMDEMENALQETHMRFIRCFDTSRSDGEKYVYAKKTINSCLSGIRTKKARADRRFERAECIDNTAVSRELDPHVALEDKEMAGIVLRVVSELDESDRHLIYDRVFDQRTFSDISHVLQESVSSIRYRYTRILRSLRELLKGVYSDEE